MTYNSRWRRIVPLFIVVYLWNFEFIIHNHNESWVFGGVCVRTCVCVVVCTGSRRCRHSLWLRLFYSVSRRLMWVVTALLIHTHTHTHTHRQRIDVHSSISQQTFSISSAVRGAMARITSACSSVWCVATTNKTISLLCLSQSCLVFRCGNLPLTEANFK